MGKIIKPIINNKNKKIKKEGGLRKRETRDAFVMVRVEGRSEE